MSNGASRKNFRKSAQSVHSRNRVRKGLTRGGIRL